MSYSTCKNIRRRDAGGNVRFSLFYPSRYRLTFLEISGRCAGSLGEHWEFSRSPGRTRIRVAETNFCLDGEIGASLQRRHYLKANGMTMRFQIQ